MSALLDTNVISEWTKSAPSPSVVDWLDAVPEEATFLSVITLGEIRRGVNRLPNGRQRALLEEWLTGEMSCRIASKVESCP